MSATGWWCGGSPSDRRPTVCTDVLGELIALDGARLVVRTDDGGEHAHPAGRRRGGQADPARARPATPRSPRWSGSADRGLAGAGSANRWATGCCGRPRAGPTGPTPRCRWATPASPLPEAVEACRAGTTARTAAQITVPLPLRRDVARRRSTHRAGPPSRCAGPDRAVWAGLTRGPRRPVRARGAPDRPDS